MFKKSQSVPLLHFSELCDLPETSKNFEKKSENFFSIFSFLRAFVVSSCRKSGFRFRVFLSLRYGADLGRSRLVTLDIIPYSALKELSKWSMLYKVEFWQNLEKNATQMMIFLPH